MKKEFTTNLFTGGLMQDMSPMVTPNNVLTDCLNGTLITFNGNEMMLQNDMGNARVETAFLPEGYIPLGTCSHGGFIYVVSYNPLKNLSQVGSFPSPERNIDSTELKNNTLLSLSNDEMYLDENNTIGELKALKPLLRKEFANITLLPGDKFILFAQDLYGNYLSDFGSSTNVIDSIPRLWKIRPCSILDNKTVELTNLKWYDTSILIFDAENNEKTFELISSALNKIYTEISEKKYNELGGKSNPLLQENNGKYEIISSFDYYPVEKNSNQTFNVRLLGEKKLNESEDDSKKSLYYIKQIEGDLSQRQDKPINVDEYRSLVCGAYSVFNSKKSGILGLLISPEAPETFTASFNVFKNKDDKDNEVYDIYINSSWDNQGRDVNPKGILIKGEWYYDENDSVDFGTLDRPFILSHELYKYTTSNPNDEEHPNDHGYFDSTLQYRSFEERYNNWIDSLKNNNTINYTAYPKRIYDDETHLPKPNKNGNRAVYAIGEQSNYIETTIPDDIINNQYHLDIPYKIHTISKSTIDENLKNKKNCILKLTIYPYSEAGYFPWLKNELEIDFSKIGSGIVDLTEWRYYVNNSELILDWSIESYPLASLKITSLWLEFYDNYGLCATHILNGLSSYNSDFHTLINLSNGSPSLTNVKVEMDGTENTPIKHPGLSFSTTNLFKADGETVSEEEIINYDSLLIYNKNHVHEGKESHEVLGIYDKPLGFYNGDIINPYINWYLTNDNKIAIKNTGANTNDNATSDDTIITSNNITDYRFFLNDAGILYYGLPYLVKIKYKISNISTWGDAPSQIESINTYRWLWTCPVFNEYFEGTKDFEQIKSVDLTLDLVTQFSANGNYIEKKAHINNSKLYSQTPITTPSENNMSANILYVGSSDGLPNIDAITAPMLKNNFNTFKLNEDALENISLATAIKVYNDTTSSISRDPENIEYITEYNDGGLDNLNTTNTIILPDGTIDIPDDIINVLNNDVSTIPQIKKDNDNKYLIKLNNSDSFLADFIYMNSISQEIINSEKLKCTVIDFTKEKNKGTIKNQLKFEAIHYSKYYTTGSGNIEQKLVYTLKPFIATLDDMIKYNLIYDFENTKEYRKDQSIYGFNENEYTNWEMTGPINNYILFNRCVSYAVSCNDSNSKKNATLILYNIPGRFGTISQSSRSETKPNADVLKINNSADLEKTRNEILKQCKLFFPVISATWDSPIGKTGTIILNGLLIYNFKDSIKRQTERMQVGLLPQYRPKITYIYPYTSSLNEDMLTGGKTVAALAPWWGGFLGFTTEDTIEINYYLPLVAYYKDVYNDNGTLKTTTEYTRSMYGLVNHYNGSVLTDYAHCVFSLLTLIGARSLDSHYEPMYIYDKYVYCSDYKDKFTADLILNISCSDDTTILNTLIITKIFDSNEESQYVNYLNLLDYLNSINKSVTEKIIVDGNEKNYIFNVKLNSFTKTSPILFEFNYISPEIQEISVDGATLVTDCEGKSFISENILENQIYKIEENAISNLTTSTPFYRMDINKFTDKIERNPIYFKDSKGNIVSNAEEGTLIEGYGKDDKGKPIKSKSTYFDITYYHSAHDIPPHNGYSLNSQYISYFTCPIADKFLVVNGELRINSEATLENSADKIYPTYNGRDIYNLTREDIFYFNGVNTNIADPNNVKQYEKAK